MLVVMASRLLYALVTLPAANGRALRDGVGRLPALGWNSWNAYHCDINESLILSAANALVTQGYKDAGYVYVNIGKARAGLLYDIDMRAYDAMIDDCWALKSGRDNVTKQLVPDPTKFPNGLKGTADEIHTMGLRIGIYSSAGTETCAGYPASIGYENIDASSFASWGIDYLKYDNCNVPSNLTDSCNACTPDQLPDDEVTSNGTCINTSSLCPAIFNYVDSETSLRYHTMGDAINAQNRTILYSLCNWGEAEVWTWANCTGQSWRVTGDIEPSWSRITEIINIGSFLSNYGGFTGHNDLDMLEIGNGNLTESESRTHFALWAMMKSPLIIGTDLSTLSETNVAVLQNKFLLAFNQDSKYGAPAQPYKWGVNPQWTWNRTNPAEYWYGTSSNGTLVAMMNTLNYTRTMRADFGEIPGFWVGLRYLAFDAWTGRMIGCRLNYVEMEVEPHDTAVILFTDDCAGW